MTRRLIRLPWLLAHLLWGLLLCLALLLDRSRHLSAERLAQGWSRQLLRIFAVRLEVHGTPCGSGHLRVANHVSWLDIFGLLAVRPSRFVAKSEIRDWPVAGWLADALGTFYLRRGKGGARPLLARMTPYLQNGGSVTVFPEGTTTDGRDVRSFHPRLFSAAVEADVPVQPVSLRYSSALAPFIGDDDLVRHLWRLMGAPGLSLRIDFEALLPAASGRDALATAAEAAIRLRLRPELAAVPAPVSTLSRRSAASASA